MSRQVKTLAMGAALSLVAAAFSYALPGVVFTSHLDPVQQEELEDLDPSPSPSPTEEENSEEEEEEDGDAEASSHRDNHGAAVSIAAKCPVEGRAHGELVRSVARDREATVADAEAACDEAVAAQEEQGESSPPGRSRSKAAKPETKGSSKGSSTGSGPSDQGEASDRRPGGAKDGTEHGSKGGSRASEGKGSGQGKGRP